MVQRLVQTYTWSLARLNENRVNRPRTQGEYSPGKARREPLRNQQTEFKKDCSNNKEDEEDGYAFYYLWLNAPVNSFYARLYIIASL